MIHQVHEMSTKSESDMTEETTPETPEEAPEQAAEEATDQVAAEDEREKISWPYTEGTSSLSFRFFDIVDLPEFLDEEDSKEGRLIMALISEVLHLKGSLAVLVKERQQESFQNWLASQGKGVRDHGSQNEIMSQMKRRK